MSTLHFIVLFIYKSQISLVIITYSFIAISRKRPNTWIWICTEWFLLCSTRATRRGLKKLSSRVRDPDLWNTFFINTIYNSSFFKTPECSASNQYFVSQPFTLYCIIIVLLFCHWSSAETIALLIGLSKYKTTGHLRNENKISCKYISYVYTYNCEKFKSFVAIARLEGSRLFN